MPNVELGVTKADTGRSNRQCRKRSRVKLTEINDVELGEIDVLRRKPSSSPISVVRGVDHGSSSADFALHGVGGEIERLRPGHGRGKSILQVEFAIAFAFKSLGGEELENNGFVLILGGGEEVR